MFLASLFLTAFGRALASPVPVTVTGSTLPSPVCVVAASVTASRCDPTRTRTIFDILYSCIGVILLCTYISMHHNIPDQNDSWAKLMWIKMRMTFYALIAPEIIIMWAIRQRIMAGRIAQKNKHRGWTRTHGFFVQMGGLVQRQNDSTYQVLCDEKDVEGARIPHIPEKEIKDHGKGDLLAKALVVVQTTWFVAQCISRHVQGLVLTEIELVTLAFATLNVITYGLWWNKPLNVGYPIYFDENGIRTSGPQDSERVDEVEVGDGAQVNELKEVWYKKMWWSMRTSLTRLGETCSSICRKPSELISLVIFGVPLLVAAVIYWVVYGAYTAFVAVFGPLIKTMGDEDTQNRPMSVHPFYAAAMDEEDRFLAIIYGSVIGVLFGAVHLIGWNFKFSTTIKLWLWRASSLVLTIVPFFLAIAISLFLASARLHVNILQYIGGSFFMLTILFGPLLYVAARIILLFLAFFTLRDLPNSAYQNVRWTEYLPHI
ncbi:hypothetical protein AX16_009495 [Volvariella volvacea WC 439]|nr:hypothetical protein AX16_009495 [Volvariella volvacea WC 439]